MKQEVLKIAYVVCANASPTSGVYKKILAQCRAWRRLGHKVTLIVLSDKKHVDDWRKLDCDLIEFTYSNRIQWFWNRLRVVKSAIQLNPSLVYVRDVFPLYFPKSTLPVILEVQSLTGKELRIRSRVKARLYELLRKYVYQNVFAAIFVTPELKEVNEIGISDVKLTFDLGTGIDFETISPLGEPIQSERLGVFFLGTGNQAWQGILEIIDLARSNIDMDFHVVGGSFPYHAPDNVFFHGDLSQEEYWPIASRCSVALGTLNQSITGMRQAVPLKVREYLALGLPVAARYQDPYLDSTANYFLSFPLDNKEIISHNFSFREFVDHWRNERVPRSAIHSLSFLEVETTRIQIFNHVLRYWQQLDEDQGPGSKTYIE